MTTPGERQQAQREEKLAQIEEQVEEGQLVIRQMTDAERKKFGPPKPRQEKPGRRGRPERRDHLAHRDCTRGHRPLVAA